MVGVLSLEMVLLFIQMVSNMDIEMKTLQR